MLTDLLCDDHTTKETAAYRLLLDNYEEQFRNAAREFMYSIYFDTNNCDNAAT